jgi:dethiobiotin synthetase
MRPRGLFVTGTDTGVGKTVVAAAIASALAERGERVAVFKPAITGLDEPGTPDDVVLTASARSPQTRKEVSPYRFGPPLSPHLAAELAGASLDPSVLVDGARRAANGADALITEGVGGLLVPLRADYLVRDFAAELGLPLVVAARPGLGTINHTLLTVAAAREAALQVAAVVFTPWPECPGAVERSNLETVGALAGVEVATLGPLYTAPPIPPAGDLPLDAWLGAPRRVTAPAAA